jgi:hypothetical protein
MAMSECVSRGMAMLHCRMNGIKSVFQTRFHEGIAHQIVSDIYP